MMGTAAQLMEKADAAAERERRYTSRKRVNKIALGLSLAAMAFGIFWLVWILWETIVLGVGGLGIATFTQMTPPTPCGARS
jgi:phosphate transport system permease protein